MAHSSGGGSSGGGCYSGSSGHSGSGHRRFSHHHFPGARPYSYTDAFGRKRRFYTDGNPTQSRPFLLPYITMGVIVLMVILSKKKTYSNLTAMENPGRAIGDGFRFTRQLRSGSLFALNQDAIASALPMLLMAVLIVISLRSAVFEFICRKNARPDW